MPSWTKQEHEKGEEAAGSGAPQVSHNMCSHGSYRIAVTDGDGAADEDDACASFGNR